MMRTPTDNEIDLIREEIYRLPSFEEVQAEMKKVHAGQTTRMSKMNKYYFYKERSKACGDKRGKPFAIVLESKEQFMEVFDYANKYQSKFIETQYPDPTKREANYVKYVAEMMTNVSRLLPYYRVPSMFSLEIAKNMMRKYNVNNIVYDYACGWGQRLIGALSENLIYFGTDTNPELCEELRRCASDYIQTTGTSAKACILNQPSEKFIPQLEGKVGLCFSSPPYFDLEIYNGEQTSTTLYNQYDLWIDGYYKPTLENCKRYIVPGGYIGLNIKDMPRRPMYTDGMRICQELGLFLVEEEPFRVKERRGCAVQKAQKKGHADEKIMIYSNDQNKEKKVEEIVEEPVDSTDSTVDSMSYDSTASTVVQEEQVPQQESVQAPAVPVEQPQPQTKSNPGLIDGWVSRTTREFLKNENGIYETYFILLPKKDGSISRLGITVPTGIRQSYLMDNVFTDEWHDKMKCVVKYWLETEAKKLSEDSSIDFTRTTGLW